MFNKWFTNFKLFNETEAVTPFVQPVKDLVYNVTKPISTLVPLGYRAWAGKKTGERTIKAVKAFKKGPRNPIFVLRASSAVSTGIAGVCGLYGCGGAGPVIFVPFAAFSEAAADKLSTD